jgi:uncharacterized membrane protein
MKLISKIIPVVIAFALVITVSGYANAQICVGQQTQFTMRISNTGTEDDTYSIIASDPGWIDVQDTIDIAAGQIETIQITATPPQTGTNFFELTITGSRGVPKKVPGSVTAQECRDVTIISSPSELIACERAEAVFNIIVKNRGQIVDTYDLTTSMGSLEHSKVTLEPGESTDVALSIDTEGVEEENEISISAESGTVSDTDRMILRIKNCYAAEFRITPKNKEVCPTDAVTFQVYLKNTGELEDEYLLTIMDEITQTVTLEAEESRFFNFSLPLEEGAGTIDVDVKAESASVALSDSANLIVKSADECYSAALKQDVINVRQCTATAVPITLKNLGGDEQTFRLNIEGPEWVHLSSNRAHVGPGDEKEVYLYISPLYETDTDAYSVTINSESDQFQETMDLTINVMPNVTGQVPPSPPTTGDDDGDVVTGDDDNVSLNISIGGDDTTGAITLGTAPLWKTVVVAFITLVIVVILVVRFAILVKQ